MINVKENCVDELVMNTREYLFIIGDKYEHNMVIRRINMNRRCL